MNELPMGWHSSSLEGLFEFVLGGDWGKDESFDDPEFTLVYCIRGSEFKNWIKDKGRTASLRKIKKASLEKRQLREGDILIEISGGGPDQPVGRTVLIDKDAMNQNVELPKVCTNFLRLARPSSVLDSRYLNYFLSDFYLSGEVVKYQGGSNNLRNLKFKDYSKIDVSLAPINEQSRIANKLDSLLAKVQNTQTRLEKIPGILKRFRQSVLIAATSGELTKDWRLENQVTPLQPFLDNIQRERESLKFQKKLKKNFCNQILDDQPSTVLPNSWVWVNFDSLAKNRSHALKAGPFGSALKKDDYSDAGYKIYGQEQVIAGNENLVTYYINNDKFEELVSCKTEPGDILISLVGTIGKVLVLTESAEEGIINPRLVKLSLSDEIDSYYIKIFIDSPEAHHFFSMFSHGGTMEILNLKILRSLPIALPPIEEQKEIVRRVESLFDLADKVEKQYQAAKQRTDRLTQSLLAKAFRGELVPQDPRDEPASELLKRIQVELEKAAIKKKKG